MATKQPKISKQPTAAPEALAVTERGIDVNYARDGIHIAFSLAWETIFEYIQKGIEGLRRRRG